jgi:hypothetical protein
MVLRLPLRLVATAAGLVAAGAAAFTLTSLPPRQELVAGQWSPSLPAARVRGVYHVHSTRSDGTGTVEDIARAAARARLDFVILTDHGDATRTFDPPRYVSNVLVVDAVEVSTRLGHVSVLGLPAAAPYRLAGWPDDVMEDVRRLGAIGVATHPDSPRHSLSWRDWSAALHGFEWLNADSQWRDESRWELARVAAAYPWRPVEAIAAMFDRPDSTLARWDALSKGGRFLVTLAGADAHARLGFRDDEDDGEAGGWALKIPDYETIFRAFSTVAELDAPFGQGAEEDAARLIQALAHGRSYTVIDGLATPGRLEYFVTHPGGVARMGDRLDAGTAATFTVRTAAPAGAEIRLLRNGELVASSTGLELTSSLRLDLREGERGASFRAEVAWRSSGRATVPWILTNPVFVAPADDRGGDAGDAESPEAVGVAPRELDGIDLRSCAVEKDQVSSASVHALASGDDLSLDFHLAESPTSWVALACTLPRPLAAGEGLAVDGLASRPMRLDVQLRDEAPGGGVDRRWSRSVYLEPRGRRYVVPVRALRAVSLEVASELPGGHLRVLFVVDRVHGTAGMRATVRLQRLRIVAVQGGGDQVRTVSSR